MPIVIPKRPSRDPEAGTKQTAEVASLRLSDTDRVYTVELGQHRFEFRMNRRLAQTYNMRLVAVESLDGWTDPKETVSDEDAAQIIEVIHRYMQDMLSEGRSSRDEKPVRANTSPSSYQRGVETRRKNREAKDAADSEAYQSLARYIMGHDKEFPPESEALNRVGTKVVKGLKEVLGPVVTKRPRIIIPKTRIK